MKEWRLTTVPFVKRHPRQANAVGPRPVNLLQPDLPLRPVDDIVGDSSRPAAVAIRVPGGLRQIQFAVQQRVEVGRGVAEVDADHAVLPLTDRPAMLPLHAGGLVALLDETGLIQNADAVGVGTLTGNPLLQLVAHGQLVPAVEAQELLKGPRRRAGGVGPESVYEPY